MSKAGRWWLVEPVKIAPEREELVAILHSRISQLTGLPGGIRWTYHGDGSWSGYNPACKL